mmetsp:Transcript_63060/g.116256  ORF Transcript_63060/g.116256 Transcript_63060/m.116256 type:complete len:108 (+) Transcript_63060:74-397(+)
MPLAKFPRVSMVKLLLMMRSASLWSDNIQTGLLTMPRARLPLRAWLLKLLPTMYLVRLWPGSIQTGPLMMPLAKPPVRVWLPKLLPMTQSKTQSKNLGAPPAKAWGV